MLPVDAADHDANNAENSEVTTKVEEEDDGGAKGLHTKFGNVVNVEKHVNGGG
jgi:hypothetical protein